MVLSPYCLGDLGRGGEDVGVVERRSVEPGQLELLLVPAAHGIQNGGRIVVAIGVLEHLLEAGRSVFGIQVDIALEQRGVGDRRSAQVELALDREAGPLQHLGVQFGHENGLGEVLGTNAHRAVRRRAGALGLGSGAACAAGVGGCFAAVASAAGACAAGAAGAAQAAKSRGSTMASRANHAADRPRDPLASRRHTLLPFAKSYSAGGVAVTLDRVRMAEVRCTSTNSPSAARASSATATAPTSITAGSFSAKPRRT